MVKNEQFDVFKQLEDVVGVSALERFESLTRRVVDLFGGASPETLQWFVGQARNAYSRGLRGKDVPQLERYSGELEDFGVSLNAEDRVVVEDFFVKVFTAGDSNRVRNGLLSVAPLSVKGNGRNFFYELKEPQYGFL